MLSSRFATVLGRPPNADPLNEDSRMRSSVHPEAPKAPATPAAAPAPRNARRVTGKVEELGRSSGEVIGFSGSATSPDSGQINVVALLIT